MARKKGSLRLGGVPMPDPITGYDIICVTLPIPNHPDYIAALVGAVTELWEWQRWDKSGEPGDTRAAEAARYIMQVQAGKFVYGKCPDFDGCECGDCPETDDCDECGECY